MGNSDFEVAFSRRAAKAIGMTQNAGDRVPTEILQDIQVAGRIRFLDPEQVPKHVFVWMAEAERKYLLTKEPEARSGGASDIWFFLNPSTEKVDAVFSVFFLGITKRVNKDWEFIRRVESGIDTELADHEIWQLDWETDEVPMTEDFDFDDYDLITPTAVKSFDIGYLGIDELKLYAQRILSSSELPYDEE